jgi:hypothetical protein
MRFKKLSKIMRQLVNFFTLDVCAATELLIGATSKDSRRSLVHNAAHTASPLSSGEHEEVTNFSLKIKIRQL